MVADTPAPGPDGTATSARTSTLSARLGDLEDLALENRAEALREIHHELAAALRDAEG